MYASKSTAGLKYSENFQQKSEHVMNFGTNFTISGISGQCPGLQPSLVQCPVSSVHNTSLQLCAFWLVCHTVQLQSLRF